MSRTRAVLFLAVVLLQLAFLGGMAAKRLWLLEKGTPVLLACEPIDPRSLLSGDYVRLNLNISRLDGEELLRLRARVGAADAHSERRAAVSSTSSGESSPTNRRTRRVRANPERTAASDAATEASTNYKQHQILYVALAPSARPTAHRPSGPATGADGTDGVLWEAVGLSESAAGARRLAPVFIRGEVTSLYPLTLRYGAEEYFVPQNEGLKIEHAIREHDVTVELRVSSSGEGAIKRLFIAGQEVVFR